MRNIQKITMTPSKPGVSVSGRDILEMCDVINKAIVYWCAQIEETIWWAYFVFNTLK